MENLCRSVLSILVFSLIFSTLSGAEPTAKPAVPAPKVELMPDNGQPSIVDPSIFGGKKPGDRGLKPVPAPEKFDFPTPFQAAGSLVVVIVDIVIWLLQLAVIAFVVWIVVRAVKRKADTGSVIPAKGEKTVFDLFDDAVTELKARRADRKKELDEIDKRVPDKVE